MALYVDIEKKLGSFHLRAKFEVDGETLALLGASGCGKSMTLKCIAGIERPDRGRIVLDGETLFDSEAHIDLPPQKRRVGYLFQQYALFPNMTAEQNILCGIRSGTRAERRADQLVQAHDAAGQAVFHDADLRAVAAAFAEVVRDPDDGAVEAAQKVGKLQLQIPFEEAVERGERLEGLEKKLP